MTGVTSILSDEHFEDFMKTHDNSVVALNFWAAFAAPSLQMNSVFEELSSKFESIAFVKIDVEALEDISESFDVTAVPFFVLLRGTEVLTRISGANPSELQSALLKFSTSSFQSSPASQTRTSVDQADPVSRIPEHHAGEQDLTSRLNSLVNAAPVMLFMKGSPSAPQCGFSKTLVGLLREEGVRYGFFNILADNEVRQGLKAFSEWPTFPQLYVGGEFAGGLDVVREMIGSGEFQDMLKEHKINTSN